jgi:anti-sigma regulatory factor (Ser/Thr protein kinase)
MHEAAHLRPGHSALLVTPNQQPTQSNARPTWPLMSTLELAALPTAMSCGRLHTRLVLGEWHLAQLRNDAETLVSELLTNAVKAPCAYRGVGVVALRLLANQHQLIVAVWDQSPDDPRPRLADESAEHGRGFMVIEALAHRWGYRRVSAELKVVWCELLVQNYP